MSWAKPNKIWTDKSCEFDNRSVKCWLQHNDKEKYSTEGRSVDVERY